MRQIPNMPTTPDSDNASTCGFVAKNRVVLGGFSFFPSTSEMMTSHQGSINKDGIHDNIQLSRKHQRAVAGKPNNDPSWSSPHVECTTTVSLRASYRNAYQPIRALIRNDQKCKCRSPNLHQNKTRGCPPLGRNPLAKRWPIARLRFSFRTS